MDNQNFDHLSDEMKIALLGEQSRLLIDNRVRSEKTRRNHVIAVFVALFFGGTGLYPSKIDAFGIQINQFPAISFYIFLSLLVAYMYWSYQTHRRTATISRQIINYLYDKVISFEYNKMVSQLISRNETALYRAWQRYMPLIISIVAILACLWRAIYEALYRIPQP